MNTAALLDRLDKVISTGPNRWIATCPAHQDKTPSLSIREAEDGKILLHDFGGCDTSSVLSALGLNLSDLFPEKLGDHIKPTRSRIPLRDLVSLLDHESFVIFIVACDLLNKKTIDDESLARLRMAVQRISGVRDELT